MKPVIELDNAIVFHGSNLDVLPFLADNSVDSIVTDPPYELGFMGKKWDSTGIAYSVELWRECLRVLKPGGHLLSFGGTRTWHRVAVAIEDAGFEVRDSIAWMYGAGFPKSLNIGKSIEAKLTTGSAAKNGFHKLEGERTGEGKIGMYATVAEQGFRSHNPEQLGAFNLDATTPEAQKWDGWGTALKPAFEPVVVARKPLGGEIAIRARIENELAQIGYTNIRWTKLVNGAISPSQQQTSGSTKQQKMAETFAKIVNASEMPNTAETTQNFIKNQPNDSKPTIQADNENLLNAQSKNSKTKSSKPMVKFVNVAENPTEYSSRLTTSTVVEQNTGNEPMEKSGTNSDNRDSLTVIESFAGIATGLSGSQATVHINLLSDGSFQWPQGLPEVHKVGNTVAQNVLEWGVGGLNIDASRIASEGENFDNLQGRPIQKLATRRDGETDEEYRLRVLESPAQQAALEKLKSLGRWPANVVLDEYSAALLDEQSDASRFFYVSKTNKRDRNEGLDGLPDYDWRGEGAAIPERENRPFLPSKNHHPTVKPTDLMRYLIKLVTPEGGTILDPFTGSGSTGKAALLDGYKFIGIELTEEYIPIIEGRLKHAAQQNSDKLFNE